MYACKNRFEESYFPSFAVDVCTVCTAGICLMLGF